MGYAREIEFARRATRLAGENGVRIRRGGIAAETKPDDSPVTLADRENERLLFGLIDAEFPDDGILGEEGARKQSRSGRTWTIDPIDGTRDFVRGNLFWNVLLGLEQNGEAVAGAAHFPMLGHTYWASRGEGAYRDGERLGISSITDIGAAVFSPNGMHMMARERYAPGMMDFMSRFWAVRSIGGALDAAMLASGQIEVWLERKVEVWDLAPLQVLIEEAGGRVFALDGTRRIDGGNAVACVPALESEVRTFFGIGSATAT
jgi:histidinol phosphatase-like enzyme (inositol monophosphatase family)